MRASMIRRGSLWTAVAAIAVLALAPTALAAKKTLIGSGSSVAEPYLRALFAGYKKVEPKVKFVFTANNGNAGAQGRAGRQEPVRDPDAPAAPVGLGARATRSCSSTASASRSTRPTSLNGLQIVAGQGHLPRHGHRVERRPART